MADLKINIHGRNDHNTIIEKEYPKFEENLIRLSAEGGSRADQNVRIVFEASAVETVFDTIDWGSKYQYGDVEQAGILIGNYYRDSSGREEVIWADVMAVIPADPALVNASFSSIHITAEAWQKMYDDFEQYRTENLQIVGWYHTHLDNISTRFSGIDIATQRRAFTYEHSFGVVFNPNRKKWSVFYGPDSHECIGEALLAQELLDKYGEPKIKIKQVNGDSELLEDGSVVHFDADGCPIENDPVYPQYTQYADPEKIPSLGKRIFNSISNGINTFRGGRGQRENPIDQHPERHMAYPSAYSQSRCPAHVSQQGSHPVRVSQQGSYSAYTSSQRRNTGQQHISEVARDADTPKIEILDTNTRPNSSAKECVFYSMTPEGQLDKASAENRMISMERGLLEKISQYERNCTGPSGKQSLWGNVRQIGGQLEMSLVSSESDANTKIVSTQNGSDYDEMAALGMQWNSDTNINYYILIGRAGTSSVEIKVIKYN